MRPSLLAARDREAIVARLGRLRPDAPPRWGTRSAPEMLCRATDQLRVALAELPAEDRSRWLVRVVVRPLVVGLALPCPGLDRDVAPPPALASVPGDWEADLAACEVRIARVGAGAARGVHPLLGPVDPSGWARLAWRHLDRHLRQFGG